MNTTDLYPRRSNTRAWLMLVAAAGAVLVMLVLIMVACQARGGDTRAAGAGSTSAEVDDDATSRGGSGGGGSGGAASGSGASGSGQPDGGGEEDAGGGEGGGPGDGSSGGSDGGSSEGDPGDDGPHDTWPLLTGLEVVRETHAVPGDGYLRTGVHCPDGKVVLNGGFSNLGPDSFGEPFILQESTPGTVGGGAVSLWLLSISNTMAGAWNIEAYAVCADPPPGYEVVGYDADLDPSAVIDGTPACPDGKSVLGGGAQVVGAGSANFGIVMSRSAPAATAPGTFGWKTVLGNGTPVSRTIGFRVVCSNTIAGLQMVSHDVAVGPASVGTTAASCPDGAVIGGGLAPVDGHATQWIPETYPDIDAADWVATFRNSAAGDRVFRAWAICAQAG